MKCNVCLKEDETVKVREGCKLCKFCYNLILSDADLKDKSFEEEFKRFNRDYNKCLKQIKERRKSNGRNNL